MQKNYKHTLSIIIVNYNVEYFLEQCLNSVYNAIEGINAEVFVVDNNSVDNSIEMVKAKFPSVKCIENKVNVGFSKANNQAILESNSEFILLLNPDTVVEESTFRKVIDFMKNHPDAGGLGVRMVDGKGRFLPESKRGLPTPAVAFYKIFGLSKLFKKSPKFNRYHLGYLAENKNHEVDILSGAFMLMRAEALEKVGLLDETFFMYGEDIDLSYRIQLGGWKNYYCSDTTIIHYKGESTKKSSVNYVFVFYRAMVIFAQKHFSKNHAKSFSTLINLAIYFRASLSIAKRIFFSTTPVFLDFIFLLGGLFALTNQWKLNDVHFPISILLISLPFYTTIWLFFSWIFGLYDRDYKIINILKSLAIGTIFILVIYALLPKDWQFSRLYILTGALWSFLYFIISRMYLSLVVNGNLGLLNRPKTFAIVGDDIEFQRVSEILKGTGKFKLFRVSPTDKREENSIGTINQLDQIAHINKIDEIIFCAKNTESKKIIFWMTHLNSEKLDFKIAQPDTSFLIGSNSIENSGELYLLNINAISKSENKRIKRVLDVVISLTLFTLSPILIWIYKNKMAFLQNIVQVLLSKKTMIGYQFENSTDTKNYLLPAIKNGVIPVQNWFSKNTSIPSDNLNIIYARDYSPLIDLKLLLKNLTKLDFKR
ncbi:MAG: glycosyltransferase family 2 protein [Crocinitomicaceae bacterium]